MEDGERVFILETDRQGTISNWAARRANPEPVVERITDRFQLERALRTIERRDCTLAIIDTPGTDNDFVTDVIRAANLCLIPARPSQADIEATVPTLKIIRRLICLCPYPNLGPRTAAHAGRLGLERGWSARASLYCAA